MADTLTSEIKVSLGWLLQDANALSTVADNSQLDYHQAFADGTDVDQADKVWHDERTLSSGANEDLVLSNLPQTLFGNSLGIALAKVKAILLVNTAIDAGEDLCLAAPHRTNGKALSRQRAIKSLCRPIRVCCCVNKKSGWTVTAGSADKLRDCEQWRRRHHLQDCHPRHIGLEFRTPVDSGVVTITRR